MFVRTSIVQCSNAEQLERIVVDSADRALAEDKKTFIQRLFKK